MTVRQLHPPLGWFHAVTVRDGEARRRDGDPFYQVMQIVAAGSPLFEILFNDGLWMLAGADDLEWDDTQGGTPPQASG